MIHPSYVEMIDRINDEQNSDREEAPLVTSRYSIVLATARRARQLVSGAEPYVQAVDKYGKPRYANLRGIGTDFKGEASGSDKRFSFSIPAAVDSDTLHLFESAIDLLSYATLRKQEGLDWQTDHMVSLAGVYRPKGRAAGKLHADGADAVSQRPSRHQENRSPFG